MAAIPGNKDQERTKTETKGRDWVKATTKALDKNESVTPEDKVREQVHTS